MEKMNGFKQNLQKQGVSETTPVENPALVIKNDLVNSTYVTHRLHQYKC